MMLSPYTKEVIVTAILALSTLLALGMVCLTALKYHEQSLIYAPVTVTSPPAK